MARLSKPSALKIIDGNPGKTKINKEEITIGNNLCDIPPPSDLNYGAKKVWQFVVSELPPYMFKTVDMGELKIYCIAYDLHQQAYRMIKKNGLVVSSQSPRSKKLEKFVSDNDDMVETTNPYLSIMNKQAEIMIKTAATLGFTPTARAKMNLMPPVSKKPTLVSSL